MNLGGYSDYNFDGEEIVIAWECPGYTMCAVDLDCTNSP